jgi:hypothetical protein
LSALRALNGNLYALSDTGGLSGGDSSQPFVLRLLAGFATLWFVLQSFIMEKGLLA